MDDLGKRAVIGALKFYAMLAVLLFVPAWSLTYWQGWIYWLVLLVCTLAPSAYFLKHDRALVERRMAAGPVAEREPAQKVIQTLMSVFGCATILVAVLDHRFHELAVPTAVVIAADALIVIGFVIVFITLHANSFAAAIIVISPGQSVVRTGPYAIVRHPMYSGALIAFLATPVALGSWWGLIPAALVFVLMAWRAVDEEAFLVRNLPGYAQYRREVRFRLVPGLW
jgi:protein-S-isoprenylcysteine O-methyltransferase Ste14